MMRRLRLFRSAFAASLLALGWLLPEEAAAHGAVLQLVEPTGHVIGYPTLAIVRLEFPAGSLLVVQDGGADSYPTRSLSKLTFAFPTSGVQGGTEGEPGTVLAELLQSTPNPTSGPTQIRFTLDQAGRVRLAILDVRGTLVRKVADDQFERGGHALTWDGRDDVGRAVPAGIYFYVLSGSGVELGRKLLLLRP